MRNLFFISAQMLLCNIWNDWAYKSPYFTNNSIVICKIIVGTREALHPCRKGERYTMKATGIVRRVEARVIITQKCL